METIDQKPPLVVCDAGPLIHLDELGSLDLLADFPDVLVPDAVWREVNLHRPGVLTSPVAAAAGRAALGRTAGVGGNGTGVGLAYR
jgi:hypothetical protein